MNRFLIQPHRGCVSMALMLVLALSLHGLAAPLEVTLETDAGPAKACCPQHADQPAESQDPAQTPDCCTHGCAPCCAASFPMFDSSAAALGYPLIQVRHMPASLDHCLARSLPDSIFHPPRA